MKTSPSMDEWLKEAKTHENANKIGMYLVHNGVVRQSPKAQVRSLGNAAAMGFSATCESDTGALEPFQTQKSTANNQEFPPVKGMEFSYNAEKVAFYEAETYKLPGIFYVRTWLNEGSLNVGDDIMYVLIGGDIRPHIVDALNFLVGHIKDECVKEIEK